MISINWNLKLIWIYGILAEKGGGALFADCHMHMILDGCFWKDAIDRHRNGVDEGFVCETLERYRERGFTYLRDGGDRWGAGKRARELAPEYGITYRTPLTNLNQHLHQLHLILQR